MKKHKNIFLYSLHLVFVKLHLNHLSPLSEFITALFVCFRKENLVSLNHFCSAFSQKYLTNTSTQNSLKLARLVFKPYNSHLQAASCY